MSAPAMGAEPIARDSLDGERLWVIGGLYTYKATTAETSAYLACEVRADEGFAIPVHSHDDEDEAFYVASGEATIFIGDEARPLASGGFAFAPRGVTHAFRLDAPGSVLLLLLSPGSAHEAMFRAMGEPASEPVIPPMPPSVDPELLAGIAARHGTRIVGPPPAR